MQPLVILGLLAVLSMGAMTRIERSRCKLCRKGNATLSHFYRFANPNSVVPHGQDIAPILSRSSVDALCHLNGACKSIALMSAQLSDSDSALMFVKGLARGLGLLPPLPSISPCLHDVKVLFKDISSFGHGIENTYNDYESGVGKYTIADDVFHDFRELADSAKFASKAVSDCGLTDLFEKLGTELAGSFSGLSVVVDAFDFIVHYDNIVDDVDNLINGSPYQVGYAIGNIITLI